MTDEKIAAADNAAMQALSDAGAQCGTCGDEPSDRTCPDCERCYQRYVDALRKAGWAPRSEVLREAADEGPRWASCLTEGVVMAAFRDHLHRMADVAGRQFLECPYCGFPADASGCRIPRHDSRCPTRDPHF